MQIRARVIDQRQRLDTIVLEAADLQQARRRLGEMGLRPVSLVESGRSGWLPRAAGRDHFPVLLFAQEMLALLQAGLGIPEALEALLDKQPPGSQRSVLEKLALDLRAGLRLSDGLQNQPAAFPALFVGMIGVAERTSNVPEALDRFIGYRTRVDAVRATVASAAVYPIILLVVGMAVSLFLMGYVVPKFAQVYQGTGREIPWASRLLLEWGRQVAAHGLGLALAAAVAVLAGATLAAAAWRSGRVAVWATQLPWIGDRIQVMARARLYLTLAVLLEGGMPINQALQLLMSSAPPAQAAGLERLRQSIFGGMPLSVALAQEGLATPIALRLLRVGERSGQLGQMLRRAALFHEGENERWVQRFTRAFEPILMVAIGAVVGLIVLLLYMPIFDLAGSFQ